MSWKAISGTSRSRLDERIEPAHDVTTARAGRAAEEESMANFGNHLAYPTPDWVAYRRDEEVARARVERRTARPAALARIARALRRLARAWATAQAHNAFL
jgi:hypothetical protein